MKLLLVLSAVSLLASCGRRIQQNTEIRYVQNPYDDSQLKAYDLILKGRIDALEARVLDPDYINDTLTLIQTQVSENKVNVKKFCSNASESYIEMNGKIYAVYMVSNNFGTYLGELSDGNYQTTDTVHAQFNVTGSVVTCL